MKKLSGCVMSHATRYRDLLKEQWRETDLSEKQAFQIIKRMDSVLSQLPEAIRQAHERIIGGRLVENNKKILSLYETHAQVYHRGKSGSETEFGLQLLIGESLDGLIVDWDFGAPKNDTLHLKGSLERLKQGGIKVENVVGDRGFASMKNSRILDENHIGDHLCPRNVIDLTQRLKEKEFSNFQKRRAQTEGRIGILRYNFIGATMPAKGYERQKKHIAWSLLAHNLWLLARRLASEATLQQAA